MMLWRSVCCNEQSSVKDSKFTLIAFEELLFEATITWYVCMCLVEKKIEEAT